MQQMSVRKYICQYVKSNFTYQFRRFIVVNQTKKISTEHILDRTLVLYNYCATKKLQNKILTSKK